MHPSGFIRGPGEEMPKPLAFSFDEKFKQGSLLTVFSVTTDGCQATVPPFAGRLGLYIEGSVSPTLPDVDVRIVAVGEISNAPLQRGEVALETKSRADGFFIGGPLYDDTNYTIKASKVIQDPTLRERNFGDLEGIALREAAKLKPVAHRAFVSPKADLEIPLLLNLNAANSLIENYAACLELRSDEFQVIETPEMIFLLIILVDQPRILHIFFSNLRWMLPWSGQCCNQNLLQLLYELCLAPLTYGPTMDLPSIKKYQFFSKHLDTIGVALLPKRKNSQTLHISSLQQENSWYGSWAQAEKIQEVSGQFIKEKSSRQRVERCSIKGIKQ